MIYAPRVRARRAGRRGRAQAFGPRDIRSLVGSRLDVRASTSVKVELWWRQVLRLGSKKGRSTMSNENDVIEELMPLSHLALEPKGSGRSWRGCSSGDH